MRIKLGSGLQIRVFFICFLLMEVASSALTHDASLTWQTVHTDHFRVHFHDGLDEHALRAAEIAENVHDRLAPLFAWEPKEPTDIVLMDEVDFANGYATPLPSNRIVLWLSPPENGLFDYGPWLETLITHEYVHTLHLDKTHGFLGFLQNIFGRHPFLFPALVQPNWLIEGLATAIETDGERGVGRGQSSYFDMLMRTEVLHGIKPLEQINQPIATWPAGQISYLYGVEFFQFLQRHFSDDDVMLSVENYSRNIIPAMVNSNFRRAFGKTLKQLWQEFVQELDDRYAQQYASLSEQGIVQGQRLTEHGYMVGGLRATADGEVFYVMSNGKQQPALMRKNKNGGIQRLVELNGMAKIDVSAQGDIILAQPERFDNANVFYDLYHYSVASGEMHRLTYGKRYRYVQWSPKGDRLVAVRYGNGQFALDELSAQGRFLQTLWQGESGEIVADIDWSPQGGEIVASVWREAVGWNIELFSLEDKQWRYLTQDNSIQTTPAFTQDGQSVVFSADYDGVFNIYRMTLSGKSLAKLTSVVSGAFGPNLTENGQLYYTGYTHQGFDVFAMDNVVALQRDVVIDAGSSYVEQSYQRLDEAEVKITEYAPYDLMLPSWWTPILGITSHTVTLGASTSGSDPLMRHNYHATFGIDSESEAWFGGLGYVYDGWYPQISMMLNRAISRDTDNEGELIRSRETDYFQAGVDIPFMGMRQQWVLHGAYYFEKERDGYLAQGEASRFNFRDAIVGTAVSYNSASRYALSISQSNGRFVNIRHENSDVFDSDYEGDAWNLDWREYVAMGGEHVLALRGFFADGDEGVKQFRLGGNESDDLFSVTPQGTGIVFNRREYPLRGYPEGLVTLRGHQARLYSAEWRFPIKRIERGAMVPPVAMDQLSGLVFYDAGQAWGNHQNKPSLSRGAGVELYGDTYLLYRFPLRFRLGYAKGQDEHGEKQYYLRIGSSF